MNPFSRSAGFRNTSFKNLCLALAVLSASTATASAGELHISSGKPDRGQCLGDFAQAWDQSYSDVDQKLRNWHEAKRDFQKQKSALLNQRVLFGFGPPAHTLDARTISDAAHGVKIGANTLRRAMEVFAPATSRAARVSERAYELLETGELFVDLIDASAAEVLWSISVALVEGPLPVVDALNSTAEEIRAAARSRDEWEGLRTEVRSQLERLDRQIAWADDNIQKERALIRNRLESAFRRFCEVNKAPIARADRAQTVGGQTALIDVLANDEDPDGPELALVQVLTGPETRGQISIERRGSQSALVYRAPADFSGIDRFRYEIADVLGLRASAEVLVRVDPKAVDIQSDLSQLVESATNASTDAVTNAVSAEGSGTRVGASDIRIVVPDESQAAFNRTLVDVFNSTMSTLPPPPAPPPPSAPQPSPAASRPIPPSPPPRVVPASPAASGAIPGYGSAPRSTPPGRSKPDLCDRCRGPAISEACMRKYCRSK